MQAVRSILWIGSGEHFATGRVHESPGLDVVWERRVEAALRLPLGGFDAIVLDVHEPSEALDELRALRRRARLPILVRVAASGAEIRASLLEAGAGDVVLREETGARAETGDAWLERLDALVRRPAAPPRPATPASPRRPSPSPELVGESAPMQEVYGLVECASRTSATVLVTGETGTGKELVARAIHRGSARSGASFVAINCAAFPDTLLESELFGHVRGAFTGADRDKKGLFEAADGGTLFLDEVSETSGPFQAKLLRVLQERELRPVGGARSRRVDVRVIAASNRELAQNPAGSGFRTDLYYRLAVFPIHVPPLRERAADVVPLAEHFLSVHGGEPARRRLASDAALLLQSYLWPGNVRELENEVQRALALAERHEALRPDHFSRRVRGWVDPVEARLRPGATLRENLERIEAWLLRRALDENGGRRAETARRLGITREGLYKKMKRLGIE